MRRMVRERPECEAFMTGAGVCMSLASDHATEDSASPLASVVVSVSVSISHS